ncbi:hypothetical protein QL992_13375 [Microbacterium sp. APC 3898]|uniref:Uncharacterized protein n=1 Tax=Planococcus notacanthi TaxID=3035188 RepID=A0ABT7ZHR0_9BACL|nr:MULTISPECIES: hypothetical protein [Terrabacteria group]MDN3426693.1 hypothetical protein [Planococcus sp. APC 4016]MDN3500203.1 hypothetical protein [Microbacterium sp. APC 3898]
MRKIIFAAPFVIFASLAAVIAWVNLAAVEGGIPEDYSKEDAEKFKGEEYIETAWNHWNYGGGFADENYEKNLTFIALRAIDAKQMEALGLSREILELQKILGLIGGELGMLSDEEKETYFTVFEEKLDAVYESIN